MFSVNTDLTTMRIGVPAKLERSGIAVRLVLCSGEAATARVDEKLVMAIAQARAWWQELIAHPHRRIADIAAEHGHGESWVTRTIRLALLDPAIVELVIAGKAPANLNLDLLRDARAMPLLWREQRVMHRIGTGH